MWTNFQLALLKRIYFVHNRNAYVCVYTYTCEVGVGVRISGAE